jgi:hypothetical protein
MISSKTGSGSTFWWNAFGYLACYVPFSALTKQVSKGGWPEGSPGVAGLSLLPLSSAACVVVMVLFLGGSGWWRDAPAWSVGPFRIPHPRPATLLSGLCTSLILTTTTLAYTFKDVSILLVMLLMRGGVLAMAPVIDALTGRTPRPAAWGALGLAALALVVTVSDAKGGLVTTALVVNLSIYLAAYFVRLQLMSRLAKSGDRTVNRRYFVEEQLVVAPASLLLFAVVAFTIPGDLAGQLHGGFVDLPAAVWAPVLLIGALSQGAGIFGTLVFLDPRENTFAVLVNRSSSIVAGVLASYLLWVAVGAKPPANTELIGAVILMGAMALLALGDRVPWLRKRTH